MDLNCSDLGAWREVLSGYQARLESLGKPDLLPLDAFYRHELPLLLRGRDPNPFITKPELRRLMQWKLSRGKWRPRLLDFVTSLDEKQVEAASRKAFESLPDLSKAVLDLTMLKGVGPATASAVLAAYAPDVAPFMSDEAMMVAVGNAKDYSLKQYLVFAERLQSKARELSGKGETFTPSDVERALWSSAISSKLKAAPEVDEPEAAQKRTTKRRRKS